MKLGIPSTISLLTLSIASTGCSSDAEKFANTMEKICKSECECPEALEEWNDVKSCKQSCENYADEIESYAAQYHEGDACNKFGRILKDIKKCANKGCGEADYECFAKYYEELNECWPIDYAGGYGDDEEMREGEALARQLFTPIPSAGLGEQTLHSATAE